VFAVAFRFCLAARSHKQIVFVFCSLV